MLKQKQKISVFITDVDNTLFDWFDLWYYPFRAMMDKVSAGSGIPLAEMLPEIREIHQRHGTSEYSFLLQSIPSLIKKHPNESILEVYRESVDVFSAVRREHMKLYENVIDTFEKLKAEGTLIVAYTESKAYYTNYRLRKLKLDNYIDYLYSPSDHDLPEGSTTDDVRSYSSDHYLLKVTEHRYTPPGAIKPNPEVLLDIVNEVHADVSQCLYIGDSLIKDVGMAQQVGVTDVYAEYGVSQNHCGYELLRQVSHWTDEDVEKEKQISKLDIKPSFTCHDSIRDTLDMFSFGSHSIN